MRIFKNYFIFTFEIVFSGFVILFLPLRALAFCPLCVIATGTIAGFFRWLGIDNIIIGLWLGGFVLSAVMLFNNFLIKKGKRIPLQLLIIAVSFYLIIIFGSFLTGLITPYNTIFGINKLFVGIFFGSLLLLAAPVLDKLLRARNQGRIFISHQKVLITLGLFFLVSLILYFLIK